MSKLTKKDITTVLEENKSAFLLPRVMGKRLTAQILNEMLEYKDIEDELGIDLITLFKVVKQGYVYRKIYAREEDIGTNNFEIVKTDFDLFIFEESRKSMSVLKCACLGKIEEIGNEKQCYQYLNYISSYGKTWALTKEELE